MKLVTVSGPPSSGKTSAILKAIECLEAQEVSVGVVKFDCLTSDDPETYRRYGLNVPLGLAGAVCPDHYFICNIEECVKWGRNSGFDLLITESAGLCDRCSPHIRDVPAICVVDNLAGIGTPKKLGPMLRFADAVVVTKGDVVSQAEREIFSLLLRKENPFAELINVNGITGQGAFLLARFIANAPDVESLVGCYLRFPMPAANCAYCVGQTRIGKDYQVGLRSNMDLSGFAGKGNAHAHR